MTLTETLLCPVCICEVANVGNRLAPCSRLKERNLGKGNKINGSLLLCKLS